HSFFNFFNNVTVFTINHKSNLIASIADTNISISDHPTINPSTFFCPVIEKLFVNLVAHSHHSDLFLIFVRVKVPGLSPDRYRGRNLDEIALKALHHPKWDNHQERQESI